MGWFATNTNRHLRRLGLLDDDNDPIVGSGDVAGPTSAVSGHLAVFSGTTGKVIADGGAVPSGGTPGGSPTQLQYNNAGAFGGVTGFTFDAAVSRIVITNNPETTEDWYARVGIFQDDLDWNVNGFAYHVIGVGADVASNHVTAIRGSARLAPVVGNDQIATGSYAEAVASVPAGLSVAQLNGSNHQAYGGGAGTVSALTGF
jgi:hypothetical protein